MRLFMSEPGFKAAAARLFLVQAVLAVLFFLLAGWEMDRVSRSAFEQSTATMGRILALHPELETEIAGYFTQKASPEEISAGKAVLSRYGFSEKLPFEQQPFYNGDMGRPDIHAAILALLCFLPLAGWLWQEYRRIYSRLDRVSEAAEKVVDGNFAFLFPPDRDNSLGILYHSFSQMAYRMKQGLEKLREDRIFLRNTLSDISHQLKTPLSSLIMFNELMLEEPAMTRQDREMFLERSKQQLERIEWLVQSLLKMARLEAGTIEFRKDRMLLALPVRNAMEFLRYRAEAKGIRMEMTGNMDNAYFTGDGEWMTEALTNIIKNSIEHTGQGGMVSVHLGETALISRISVRDNGEGMDKKDIPHIFERFYRSSSSIKPESVGIGLALSKLVVEGQGGSITAWSEKGEGTEMTITLLKRDI